MQGQVITLKNSWEHEGKVKLSFVDFLPQTI